MRLLSASSSADYKKQEKTNKPVFQVEEDSEEEVDTVPAVPRPRRSMGLGYILEDAQWLDDDESD